MKTELTGWELKDVKQLMKSNIEEVENYVKNHPLAVISTKGKLFIIRKYDELRNCSPDEESLQNKSYKVGLAYYTSSSASYYRLPRNLQYTEIEIKLDDLQKEYIIIKTSTTVIKTNVYELSKHLWLIDDLSEDELQNVFLNLNNEGSTIAAQPISQVAQTSITSQVLGKMKQHDEWWEAEPQKIPWFSNRTVSIRYTDFNPNIDLTFMEEADEVVKKLLAMTAFDRLDISKYIYNNCMNFLASIKQGERDQSFLDMGCPTEVWMFVELVSITLVRDFDSKEENVYALFAFNCDWEREHGLQLVFDKQARLTRVSAIDCCIVDCKNDEMMKNNKNLYAEEILPKYTRPLKGTDPPLMLASDFNNAVHKFNIGKHKESILTLLDHINPLLLTDIDIKKDIEKDIEISHMHGSAKINIKITSDQFSVKASLVKIIEGTNRIALLRKVAELNFSELTLGHVILHGDELWFEYQTPLDLCHPTKMYNVLRSMCVYADSYNVSFIKDYKADYSSEPIRRFLSAEDDEKVWLQFQDIFTDYKKHSALFRQTSWGEYFEWMMTVMSLLKMITMPYVQGELKHTLDTSLMAYFNDLSAKERESKGKLLMQSLAAKTKEEIMKSIYHTESFFCLRNDGSAQAIIDWAEDKKETVEYLKKEQSSLDLCYYLIYHFLKLKFYRNLGSSHIISIDNALEETSGLTANDAVDKLTRVFYLLLSKN